MESNQAVERLAKVAKAVGAIAKTRKNAQQGYNFRGIDDVLDAIHGPLCEFGIVPTSRVFDVRQEERASKSGGLLIYTTLMMEVTWNAPDGSKLSTVTAGEAMDSADKSTNKAMSAALKYAYFQTLSIPLTGEDADATTPDPEPKPAKPAERKLPTILGKLCQRIGAKNAAECNAILRTLIAFSREECLDFSPEKAGHAAETIERIIKERTETLGTETDALCSLYAESIEKGLVS